MVAGLEAAAAAGRGPYELAFYRRRVHGPARALAGRFLAGGGRVPSPGAHPPGALAPPGPTPATRRPGQARRRRPRPGGTGRADHDDAVLAAAGRGHDAAAIRRAARDVKAAGLPWACNCCRGCPATPPRACGATRPKRPPWPREIARLHPCLVIAGTPLADLFAAGRFVPWDLVTALAALAETLPVLWRAGGPRGPHRPGPGAGLEAAVLAGPRHPALGARVRARALFALVAAEVAALGGPPGELTVPRRFAGEIFGQAGELLPAYAGLGLPRERIRFWHEEELYLSARRV